MIFFSRIIAFRVLSCNNRFATKKVADQDSMLRSYSDRMLKLTKKADYGLIAMRHLAEHAAVGTCSAKDLAELYSIPQEALAKILQRLKNARLLKSLQGT